MEMPWSAHRVDAAAFDPLVSCSPHQDGARVPFGVEGEAARAIYAAWSNLKKSVSILQSAK